MSPRPLDTAGSAPLVTIGIATFNRVDQTLPDALKSALAQSYRRIEVVVCDNASDDGTDAFMATQDDPRLRYHRNATNIGANANFNACLDRARGDYFLLLPDDDLLEPTFVERAVAAIGDGRAGVALGGIQVIDGEGAVRDKVQAPPGGLGAAGLFLAWFDRSTSFYLVSTLFDRRRLQETGGFGSPENLFQDVVAIARIASRHGYVPVPGFAGSFRRHDGNLGSTKHAMRWATDATYLLDTLREELPADAQRLHAVGAPYLAAKCYRYVARVPSTRDRLRLYRRIHARFGYTYAPWRYLLKRFISRIRTGLRALLTPYDRRSANL